MKNVHDDVLTVVGNTPLVRLNSVTKGLESTLYAKLEMLNPGGSVKDRIAMKIIEDAEKSGALKPGGTIVEATSGNTGAGLAMAAAIKGYKCIFVLPDKQSEEKRATLRAYGAKVVVTPTNVEPEDPRSYYSVSRRLADETPNAFYANQYHNPSNPETHYLTSGPELYDQLDGNIDVFIAGVGTGGTISGIGKYLKEKNPDVKIIGVDPVGSIYYDYFYTKKMTEAFSYVLEGIGEDFLPSTMDFTYVDEVIRVNDRECFQMTRRVSSEEGIFVGGSCGAAVAGALKYLRKVDRKGLRAVVLLPDSGSRYLSKIYNDKWMEENGFVGPSTGLGTVSDLRSTFSDPITLPPSTTVTAAIEVMRQHAISQLPVMDGDKIVGLIHERTLLESALTSSTPAERVGTLADANYCTVDPDTEVSVLADLLRRYRVALVMQDQKLKGVLTRIDIIDHIAKTST